MSNWIKEFLIDPCWTVMKVILMGIGGFTTFTLVFEGHQTWQSIKPTGLVNTMIFEEIPEFVIYLAIAFGVIATVALQYFIDFEEYERKKGESVKFGVKYIVAGICTAVTAAFVSYIVCFFGLDYVIDKQIDNIGLAFIICTVISAVVTFVIDAWLYHRIVDGTVLALWNNAQKKIREEAEAAAAEAAQALKDQELRDAVFRTIKDKCEAAGLADEEKIAKICEVITDPETQESTLDALIKAYKGA